ncbi:MAG: hypothetical protein AB7K86_14920 [Rhodospirillales bacterium]
MNARIATLAAVLLAAGCAQQSGPASERGFFGGLNAAVSGQDEQQAKQLENTAASEETRALEQRARTQQATRDRDASARDVQAAQARLAKLDTDLKRQRAELAKLRAQRGTAGRAEADRIQREADALSRAREKAAQSPSGPSQQELRELERLSGELDKALQRYGAS